MRHVRFVLLTIALGEMALVFLAARPGPVSWPPMRIAGVLLLLVVMAWVVSASLQLGRSFSVVTTGPIPAAPQSNLSGESVSADWVSAAVN